MKTRNSPKPKKTAVKKTPTPPKPSATTPTPTATPPATTVTPPTTSTAATTPKTPSDTTTPKQQKTVAAPAKSSTPKVAAKPKVGEASGSAKSETKPASASAKSESKPASGSAKSETKPASGSAKSETKPASGSAKPETKPVTKPESVSAKSETKPETETEKKVTPGTKRTVIKKRIVKVAKPKSSPVVANAEEASKKEQPVATSTNEASKTEEQVGVGVEEQLKKEEPVKEAVVETNEKKEDLNPIAVEPTPAKVESEPVVKEDEQSEKGNDKEDVVEGTKDAEGKVDTMEEDVEKDAKEATVQLDEEEQNMDEDVEDYGEEGFEEPRDEDLVDDTTSEPEEDTKVLEEENKEISAIAKERKKKKEQEIFVGGLDRDTVEDDIRKAFEVIGKVVDVRLHRNPSTNKNRGYAFVRFADKEHANKALSELKNPLIRGKRCGVAPSEDNDTLFVGNICNTWTKEAIKKKLKEFGLEGIENINLVPDVQQEGLSRGFAFVGFSSHADAMLAYKRLQKPDVVFGHTERTVKVAFAEPLRDPDPEIMAQVKSVFIDGLPQQWDEERVREHCKPYGEIERIVLARNMPSAKRKDFGFVDFNTHEAAIACINALNNTELGDDKAKSKVKVRLSNPLPKTQAVKGGLCGGFRIGRPGRGLGQGARPFNRNNFQRGNDSHARGRGRAGRFGGESISGVQHSGFRGRRPFGGQAGGRRGYNEEFLSQAGSSSRPNAARSRYGVVERGRGRSTLPRRRPLSPEGRFNRPVGGREYVDDPYIYDDGDYGLKRPYSMLDHEPGYLEPTRQRPRFDHPDSGLSSRGSRYQDSYGPGSGMYSPEYYSSSYGGGAYSSMYGGERSYGGRYYY